MLVPDFCNMDVYSANVLAAKLGLEVVFSGEYSLELGNSLIILQSIPAGTQVKKGSVVKLQTAYFDFED